MTDFQITEPGEYETDTGITWVVVSRCGEGWAAYKKNCPSEVDFFHSDGSSDVGWRHALTRRILPEKTVWVVLGHDANCGFNLDDIWIERVADNREDADAAARSIGARYRGTLTGTITIPDGGGE